MLTDDATSCANLWAIGFDDTARAAEVRDEVARLARETHGLILLDTAVAVRYPDGSFTLDGDPFYAATGPHGGMIARLLAAVALGVPPLTGAAVAPILAAVGATGCQAGISDTFVREVEGLIRPGTSALFVLDEVGNMDAILRGIRGLGGTVLRTNVDVDRARLIQSTLNAPADMPGPAVACFRSVGVPDKDRSPVETAP